MKFGSVTSGLSCGAGDAVCLQHVVERRRPCPAEPLRGDNKLDDRAMIERALGLFEEMNAIGWIAEARAARDSR